MDDTTTCPNCQRESKWKRYCEHCAHDLNTPARSEAPTEEIPVTRIQPHPIRQYDEHGRLTPEYREMQYNSPSAVAARVAHKRHRIVWHSLFWGSSLIVWLGMYLWMQGGDASNWSSGNSAGVASLATAFWWGAVLAFYFIFDPGGTTGTYFDQPGWEAHIHDGDWLHGGQCPDPSWHWTSARRGRRYPDGSTDFSRRSGVPRGGPSAYPSDSAGAGVGNGL